MRQEPRVFDTFREALGSVMGRLSIPLERWMEAGPLFRHTLSQRKLTDFLN